MTTQSPALEIRSLRLGPMDNNVYVAFDPETRRGIVVDASYDAAKIVELADGVEVERIVLTHGDRDHIDALPELKAALGVPVGIHPADAGNLMFPPDFTLEDGQRLEVGNAGIEVLHTPGHTPGSVCLYVPGTLIAGDTLFPGGPGNTRGDERKFAQIIESIEKKLYGLPDETRVLPGHGEGTTIGAERPQLAEWKARGW